jgi:hypothetical protein
MQTVTTIGLDIAKSVFQVHGVDAAGTVSDLTGRAICLSIMASTLAISGGDSKGADRGRREILG